MLPKIEQAKQLMVQALALLDDAGELRAAPHLDRAIHELGQPNRSLSCDGASAETH